MLEYIIITVVVNLTLTVKVSISLSLKLSVVDKCQHENGMKIAMGTDRVFIVVPGSRTTSSHNSKEKRSYNAILSRYLAYEFVFFLFLRSFFDDVSRVYFTRGRPSNLAAYTTIRLFLTIIIIIIIEYAIISAEHVPVPKKARLCRDGCDYIIITIFRAPVHPIAQRPSPAAGTSPPAVCVPEIIADPHENRL